MNTKGVNFQPSKRGQFSAAVDNFFAQPTRPTQISAQNDSFASSRSALSIPLLRRIGTAYLPPEVGPVVPWILNDVWTNQQIGQITPLHMTPALAVSQSCHTRALHADIGWHALEPSPQTRGLLGM
jgi:hypothetical protein